jgi:osmotically inducible protein OsmC
MATRNGSAEWSGDLQSGSGTVTVGENAWTGNYSFKSRFEDGEGTNPEELLAAAHSGCFTMALSLYLTEEGHPPERLRTTAKTTLRQVDGVPTITKVELDTEGTVPGVEPDQFQRYAEQAKDQCVVSRALAGVQEMTVTARLT